MIKNKTISHSLEDYLKTIYQLHIIDNSVRLIDIAERLSVSKPSVTNAVALLKEKNLVEHMTYGPVKLTDAGMEAAKKLIKKHDIIKRFLISVLNLDETIADSEACVIEHSINDVTLDKMELLILKLSPTLDGFGESHIVGVFDIPSDGHSVCNS